MRTWIFISIAFLSLPLVVLTLVSSTRRIRRHAVTDKCPACRYSLEGLGSTTACPECGKKRDEMVRVVRGGATGAQRCAVALLAPSIAAVAATSVALTMRPAEEVPVIVAIALVPYTVVAFTLLVFHRSGKTTASVILACTLAGLCSILLGLVMVSYWTSPIEGDDSGWPVTDIALLSLLYFVLFFVVCAAWAARDVVVRLAKE